MATAKKRVRRKQVQKGDRHMFKERSKLIVTLPHAMDGLVRLRRDENSRTIGSEVEYLIYMGLRACQDPRIETLDINVAGDAEFDRNWEVSSDE